MNMTVYLFLIRLYFRVLSSIWPVKAAEKAFRLFQRTRKLPLKKVEREFYNTAQKGGVVHPQEDIHTYELGHPKGKLVLLVHGWESNAGSMGAMAKALAEEGFRVVALDLPAHGQSTLTNTNLRQCSEALRALIYRLNPTTPFSVVSHSFGSAVAAYALSGSRYEVDQFIMLTSPNRLIDIFEEFKNQIALGNEAFGELIMLASSILHESAEGLTVEKKMQQVHYRNLTIIHDVNDKVLPYSNAFRLSRVLQDVQLVSLKDVGHYRMLWNSSVVNTIKTKLSGEIADQQHTGASTPALLSA